MQLSRGRKAALILAGLVVAGIGTAGAVLLRGVPFPSPTGPHSIGRTSYHLIDSSRPEIFTEDAGDFRELMITVHYPAEKGARAARAAYAEAPLAAGIAEAFDTPSFVINAANSHALAKPPVAMQEGGYPIVIFSPGFGQPPLFYTATLEELASHGFIVVGIYHPYSNGVTVFADGRVVRQNEAGSHAEASLDAPDPARQTASQSQDDVGSVWVKDVQFVLAELARLNRDDDLLAGRMNLSSVGIFGHSFGGATAARTVQIDDRFRAGINMDGTDFSVTSGAGIDRPFMWMASSHREPTDAELAHAGKTRAWADEAWRKHRERTDGLLQKTANGSRAQLRGAAHQTFTSDFTLMGSTWPWSWLLRGLDLGTIPGRRAVSVVDVLVVGFFQKHLQGQSVPLLDGSTREFPEVELQIHRP